MEARWNLICADVTSARYATLRVPHVEASNVKLNVFASRRADPFHDKLRRGDDLLTGVTRLAVASATPEPRDTVLGQTTVSELPSNQMAESLLFHVAPVTCWRRQIHLGLGARPRQPERPGCRQQNCAVVARSAPIGLWSTPFGGTVSQPQALPSRPSRIARDQKRMRQHAIKSTGCASPDIALLWLAPEQEVRDDSDGCSRFRGRPAARPRLRARQASTAPNSPREKRPPVVGRGRSGSERASAR